LLVNAVASPELSMQPARKRSPITLVMPDVFTLTATVAVVECASDPEVPATVSLNSEGVTKGARLTVNVEDAEPPLGGVTELGDRDAETPLGAPDTLRATAELNPLIELTVTVEEADPPRLTVIGEMELREKSPGERGTTRNRYAAILPVAGLL